MSEAFPGVTADAAAANLAATMSSLFGPCRHEKAEPVVLCTGEVVAAVCVDCLAALPAAWGCTDCSYVDVSSLSDRWPTRVMGEPCEVHRR